MAAAIQRRARIVEIDALERGRKSVRVALAADLSVGDDVEAGFLLRLDRHDGRIVLGLGQIRLGHAPQLARAHPRREAAGEALSIDQPVRLWIAADERGWKEHRISLAPQRRFAACPRAGSGQEIPL